MGKTVILLLISLAGLLEAYPAFFQDYNKPHEKWFKAETDHFRVYYLSGLLEQAEMAASIAEEVYGSITAFYRIDMPDKVDMIVYDEDYSNGWAWASRNTIKIWVADLDFNLRGTHHWLRDVITHEFAHIVSIQAGQMTRYNIPDIRFGYFDYFNENIQTSGFTVYSFETFPLWFAEGIAQIESSRKGSDSWDSHRDMIMRVKALNNRLLPLEQMNFFAGRAIDAESGFYNQGFAVLRYIEKKYGRETIRQICDAASRLRNPTFNMALKSVIGKSMSGLYGEWAAYEKTKYQAQAQSLGTLVQGRPLVQEQKALFHQQRPVGRRAGRPHHVRFLRHHQGGKEKGQNPVSRRGRLFQPVGRQQIRHLPGAENERDNRGGISRRIYRFHSRRQVAGQSQTRLCTGQKRKRPPHQQNKKIADTL
jgi:hypothetical protein